MVLQAKEKMNKKLRFWITVIRQGLAMVIPLVLTGGLALAIVNLPIGFYQNAIEGSLYQFIMNAIFTATFGMFSVALLIAISTTYCMELNKPVDQTITYVMISLCAFFAIAIDKTGSINTEMLGVKGCFFAIITAFLSNLLLERVKDTHAKYLRNYTSGMPRISAVAVNMVPSAVVVVLVFTVGTQLILRLADVSSLYNLVSNAAGSIVNSMDNEFGKGLLYTTMVHCLWAVGFHGGHMLEDIALNSFAVGQAGNVFSKSFFDIYVVIGGCGTTICVLLSILIFFRKTSLNKIAKLSIFTVIFNLNEILTFGIPILLNPTLIIPFILTPILCYVTAFAATACGLVPPVTQDVIWSTPFLANAYVGTGSIRGSLLQVFLIIMGVAVYTPFIKKSIKKQEKYAKFQMEELVEALKEAEESNESIDLLSQSNRLGQISRVLRNDLERAIEKKELFMLFQPQVDYQGRCIGGEALLRWVHPLYGFIFPPLIVYLAKHGDLMEALEKEIISTCVEAIEETNKVIDQDFKISMNLTSKSFNWEIEEYLEKTLADHRISPAQLWIEITEQDVLNKSSLAIDKIENLNKKGHVMMIDDFGMGHTSILYLQTEHFGVVKLDGSLVKDIQKNKTNQEIISSIASLAARLNVRTIAEFVETEEQKEMLHQLGCDWYQGYFFGKPMPLNEFIDYMKEHS